MCVAWFALFGSSYLLLLLYHLFHSLLCTIDVPMVHRAPPTNKIIQRIPLDLHTAQTCTVTLVWNSN